MLGISTASMRRTKMPIPPALSMTVLETLSKVEGSAVEGPPLLHLLSTFHPSTLSRSDPPPENGTSWGTLGHFRPSIYSQLSTILLSRHATPPGGLGPYGNYWELFTQTTTRY